MTDPHKVIRRGPLQVWQRYDDPGPKAWCAKKGCRWTWDGIGDFDHFKEAHEELNKLLVPALEGYDSEGRYIELDSWPSHDR